jgi:hypothetical protein
MLTLLVYISYISDDLKIKIIPIFIKYIKRIYGGLGPSGL